MSSNYFDIANEFISTLNKGTMPGVVYDTAVVATLSDNLGISMFPTQVKKVLSLQHDDGSWGSNFFNPYDRLLSTASSLHMISELQIDKNATIQHIYEKGIIWLEENYNQKLDYPHPLPVGFEFLFPYYAGRVMEGTNKLSINLGRLEKNRIRKLSKVNQIIFDRPTPLLFSMEGIVDNFEMAHNIGKFQSNNGSIAASPAATSLLVKYKVKKTIPSAMNYLQKSTLSTHELVHFDDFQYMNTAFSLYPLFKADYKFGVQALYVRKLLSKGWTDNGIAFGKSFLIPDSDDTAVALIDLNFLGEKNTEDRMDILIKYENDNYFNTYFGEINPSLMTNIHILEAFLVNDHPRKEEIIAKLVKFLKNNITNPLEVSKYNSSIIIQLSSLVLSLIPEISEVGTRCLDILITNIKIGIEENTLNIEEYGHALLALVYAKKHGEDVDVDIINQVHKYLKDNLKNGIEFNESYTWTAKVQYSPTQISIAYIIASLMIYDQII